MKKKAAVVYAIIAVMLAGMLGGCGAEGAAGAGDSAYNPSESDSTSDGNGIDGDAYSNDDVTDSEAGNEASDGNAAGADNDTDSPDLITVTISATGDCAIGSLQTHGYAGSFDEYFDKNGADYFLGDVRDIFESDDFTLVNCECVLTNETVPVDKEYCIKGRPEYVEIFSGSSVEGATLGNNHNADYGEQSLVDTENALEGAGIEYALNTKCGIYETADGIRIGFVSVSMLGDFPTRSSYMETGLKSLRDSVDILIACPHAGIEREHYANESQQSFSRQCIDWGADLVIGNHPHVLQGMEVYNGKVIVYSLGNFCFGANRSPSDRDTVIFQQSFTFADDELLPQIDARVIPCSISSTSERNDFRPMVYTEQADIERVISRLNDYSESFGGMYIDESGQIRHRAE